MKITVKELYDTLVDFDPSYLGDDLVLDIQAIRNNFADTRSARGILYLMKRSDLENDQKGINAGCFILINDLPQEPLADSGIPLILLSINTDLEAATQTLVAKVFPTNNFEEFKDKLLDALVVEDSLEDILRLATSCLKNYFSVFTSSGSRLLAHSCNIEMVSENTKYMIRHKFVSPSAARETVAKILDCHYQRILLPSGISIIRYPLMDKKRKKGVLTYHDYVRPISQADCEYLQYLVKIVTIATEKQYPNKCLAGTIYEDFLIDLLQDQISTETILARIDALKLKFASNISVLTIKPKKEGSISNMMWFSLKHGIENLIPCSYSVVFNNSITCIVNLPKEKYLDAEVMANIKNILREGDYCAGFSNPFSDITQFKIYHQQAEIAIQTGLTACPEDIIYLYESFMLNHILLICSEKVNIDRFCSPAIQTLMEYDEKYNTKNIETLRIYIESMGNLSECARILNIHYNTVKYRLKMIQTIANMDLQSQKYMSTLYFSFLILDQAKIDGKLQ